MDGRLATVDDKIAVCRRLTKSLTKDGYEVEAFIAPMAHNGFPIVFLDLEQTTVWLREAIKMSWSASSEK